MATLRYRYECPGLLHYSKFQAGLFRSFLFQEMLQCFLALPAAAAVVDSTAGLDG